MTGADQRRLERYDLFAANVRRELADIEAQMAEQRAEGRTRSATYQQLVANHMLAKAIIERLKDAGL